MTANETSEERRSLFRRVRRPVGETGLSDDGAAALAAQVSDDPVILSLDDLACADCGCVVPGPLNPSTVTHANVEASRLPNSALSSAFVPDEPMTVCPACEGRRALAERLASDLLSGGLSVGGFHYGRDHAAAMTASALAGLAVIGSPLPDPDRTTRAVLVVLLRGLVPHCAAMGWSARFSPVRDHDARPGTANPRPWAHVRESKRSALRSAYAEVLAARLSLSMPPEAISPPPLSHDDFGSALRRPVPLPGACLMCGIGTQTLAALEIVRAGGRERVARDVWTVRRVRSLGGSSVVGHLCRACEDAVEAEGAWGPSAMERSLVAYLDKSSNWRSSADGGWTVIDGLVGWGVLAERARRSGCPLPAANRTRWAHLAGLDALSREIAAGAAR